MAHTTFRKSVPYNTIRLGGDVAQWSIYEITSADDSSYSGKSGMSDVSMADMQRANSSAVDPNGGRVNSGLLSLMRYGIAESGDISSGDGVYASQVLNVNSDFVGTRVFNLASNPTNIRLGRLAQWDYTAVVTPADMDEMDFYNGGSTIWVETATYGQELFKDMQLWASGVKQDGANNTRRPIIIRSANSGDKFSTYPQTNFAVGSHASDMNDINQICPIVSTYGSTFNTNKVSYATFGRRTSSTSQLRAQAYTINVGSNGTLTTATTGTTGNFTTGASSNYAPGGSTIIRDNLMVVVGGRGASGQYINRLTWGGSSFSSTNATISSTAGNGAIRSDVVSTDNFGTSNNRTAVCWTENRSSTWNRYLKIQMYNMNSGISTVGSTTTLIDASNSLKSSRMTLLATDSNYMFVLIATADTSGDIRLNVVRWNYGGNSWTSLATGTYQYNDTSVNNWHTVTTLSAVEKTSVTSTGEVFNPGGTNDFEQRVYWCLCAATNSETDDVELQYGYYDITNNNLVFTNSGTVWTGRNAGLAKNPYNTDARSNLDNLPIRNEAGPVYMPILGGRYVSSIVKNLSISMIGLDYKPDWGNSATGDPGSDIISTTGEEYTDLTGYDTGVIEPNWDVLGVWRVIGPHPSPNNVPPSTTRYSLQATNRDAYGYEFAAIGANLNFFTAANQDKDNNDWQHFFENTLVPYAKNQTYYVRLSTNNGSFAATYTVTAGGKKTAYVDDAYLYVDWRGNSNSHAGSSWAFLNQGIDTYIGIEFSQTPF